MYRNANATYRGAAPTRLSTSFTQQTTTTVRGRERNLRQTFRMIRDRARNLEEDNLLAAAVLDRAVENVIGVGIGIKPLSSDEKFNAAVASAWKKWTKGKTADISHAHTFAAVQRLAYRGKLRDGDCGVLLTEEKDSRGIPHPRLQVIESEHIDSPYGVDRNQDVIDGVELNANNAAVRYHLLTEDEKGQSKPLQIRARDFVYLARPALYSSIRGTSAFDGGWTLFDQIVGYLESVVVASRIGASQAALVLKRNPGAAMASLPGTVTNSAGNQQKSLKIEPGMIHFLGDGEDVKGFNPTQPQQNFPDAIAAFARFVGLRLGLTLEQILLDFSRTNYSSSRAAKIQAFMTAYQEQEDFASTFHARIYPWFVAKLLKSGQLTDAPLDGTAYDFDWIPQGRPLTDPTKEIAAMVAAVGLGIDARSLIAAEIGMDFDALVKINASDLKKLQAAGLPTDLKGDMPAIQLVAPPPQEPNAA